MKSEAHGVDTSEAEVTHISKHGFWLLLEDKESFLPFEKFPWFREAPVSIKGIGLSTYTKFLNFLSVQVHGHAALILDNTIIRIANQGVFEELAPLRGLNNNNVASSYTRVI